MILLTSIRPKSLYQFYYNKFVSGEEILGERPFGYRFAGRPIGNRFGGRPIGNRFGGRPIGNRFGGRPIGYRFGGRPIGNRIGGRPIFANRLTNEPYNQASGLEEHLDQIENNYNMEIELLEPLKSLSINS